MRPLGCAARQFSVMAVLVTAIHVLFPRLRKTWMPGTSPGMTTRKPLPRTFDTPLPIDAVLDETFYTATTSLKCQRFIESSDSVLAAASLAAQLLLSLKSRQAELLASNANVFFRFHRRFKRGQHFHI